MMAPEDFFDMIVDACLKQQQEFEKTGEWKPLELPQHDVELKVDPNDPPEVRRRVIYYRAKLREWAEFGRQNEAARRRAEYMCLENIQAIFDNIM